LSASTKPFGLTAFGGVAPCAKAAEELNIPPINAPPMIAEQNMFMIISRDVEFC
jgi:hypothetical protein